VNEAMPVGDVMLLSQCNSDPQATIAALQRKLKHEKIELPPNEGIAQPPGSTRSAQ
jgi:hypothetical protein